MTRRVSEVERGVGWNPAWPLMRGKAAWAPSRRRRINVATKMSGPMLHVAFP